MALTVSDRSLGKRGDNGATNAFVKPRWGKVPQRVRLHVLWNPTGDTLNKAYLEECLETGDDSSCSPSEKKHQTERQDNRKEMGLREHAGREPACHNWFRELRLSIRWWTVVRQDVAVNDACVSWRQEDLSMKMAVTTTTHHSYTWCCVAQDSTALQEYSDPGPCARWEPPARSKIKKTGTFFRRGNIPNSPRVTSPYPKMGTTPYLCGRFQDQEVDAELHQ